MIRKTLLLTLVLSLPMVHAQQTPVSPAPAAVKANGTALIIPASGEVRMANDEARLTFMVEEQDKDQAAAASRVNRRMKEGTELMKRLDPKATLATRNYYTYPVYAEERVRPGKARQPVAWRVGQSLEMITTNLADLPQVVAKAQEKLALQGLHFGLSDAARRKLDREVMESAYRHMQERIEAVAQIMGRKAAEAQLEQVDFGGGEIVRPYAARMEMSMKADGPAVETPQFEPGETPVQMQIVARVRFP